MRRLTKDEVEALPIYSGLALDNITIVDNEEDAENALMVLSRERCLGFDTESQPMYRKGEVSAGPTLIQLSTVSQAYLLPVRCLAAVSVARDILSNSTIKKVGFGLSGDHKSLQRTLNICLSHSEDLSLTLKKIAKDKNPVGAKAAVAMVLNACLDKGAQRSNWGVYPLKKHQVLYAANDAHAAICIKVALNDIHGASILL